jgi:hypothetical protein
MLFYAPPCLQKFSQGTPCSYMLYSHAPSCHFLGIGVDTKETRNTITSYTSIFGAKTRDRKEANFSYLHLTFWITLMSSHGKKNSITRP